MRRAAIRFLVLAMLVLPAAAQVDPVPPDPAGAVPADPEDGGMEPGEGEDEYAEGDEETAGEPPPAPVPLSSPQALVLLQRAGGEGGGSGGADAPQVPTPAPAPAPGEQGRWAATQQRLQEMWQAVNAAAVVLNLSDQDRATLERLSNTLREMEGSDGRFNFQDIEDIVRSIEPGLRQRVDSEIQRRAAEHLAGRFPRVRARLVQRNLDRNYGSYVAQGMEQARQEARDRLANGLNELGVQPGAGTNVPGARNLTLAQLEQFGADSARARQIGQRATGGGTPATFPQGIRAADVDRLRGPFRRGR